MEENTTSQQHGPKKESILDKAEEMAGKISDKASESMIACHPERSEARPQFATV